MELHKVETMAGQWYPTEAMGSWSAARLLRTLADFLELQCSQHVGSLRVAWSILGFPWGSCSHLVLPYLSENWLSSK